MRHPNSARFHEILTELGKLHDKKQEDYGKGDDPFSNVRASEEWGVKPWVGAMVRLNDKVKRLQKPATGGSLANEGIEDSLRDIAVYAVIALVLFEQEKPVLVSKVDGAVTMCLPHEWSASYVRPLGFCIKCGASQEDA